MGLSGQNGSYPLADMAEEGCAEAATETSPPASDLAQLAGRVASMIRDGDSLDGVLIRGVAHCLSKVTGRQELPLAIPMVVVALVPFYVAAAISFRTREPVVPSVVPLASISLVIFASLCGLHSAVGGWRSNAEAVVSLLVDSDSLRRVEDWAASAFDIRRQSAVSAAIALSFVATASVAASLASYHPPSFLYVSAFLGALLPGSGFYWGVVSPRGVRAICDSPELRVCSFDACATIGIQTLSDILGTHSVVGAVMIVLGASAFAYIGAQQPGMLFRVVLAGWVGLGLANELWVFAYPQYRLYRAIIREKRRALRDLQNRIDAFYDHMTTMEDDTCARVRDAVELYNLVKSTKNTPLGIVTVIQQTSSALLPFVAFVVGELDWNALSAGLRR